MAAGQFYLCCRAWPCGCCMPGAVDSLATLTSLLLAVPTAVTLHSICRISPTWQDPASLLGQAGECTWLRESQGPSPTQTKFSGGKMKQKGWKSVSFPFLPLSFFMQCFPFEMPGSPEGRRVHSAEQPFRNVSFHAREPRQRANHTLRSGLCRLHDGLCLQRDH